MNHGDVGGNVDSAVLLGSGEAEHVVVLIDGAAHRAQGVVAVGQNVGERELLHPGRLGGLHDANKGDVVAGHGVEFDLQILHVAGCVVLLHNGVSHRALSVALAVGFPSGQSLYFRRFRFRNDLFTVNQVDAPVIQ